MGFDYEIIDKAYRPYDNMSLLVLLKSDGSIEKRVVASVTESLKADPQFGADWDRLVEIFRKPSLQMVSFTITEKGYSDHSPADLEQRGGAPAHHGQGHRPAVRAAIRREPCPSRCRAWTTAPTTAIRCAAAPWPMPRRG